MNNEHFEKYEALAQKIGIEKLISLVPATKDQVKQALLTDENLNNIALKKWDNQDYIVRMYAQQVGIKSWALFQTVCTLKHVARYHYN